MILFDFKILFTSLGNNVQAEQSTFFFSPLTLGSQGTLSTSSTASSTGSSAVVVAASGLGSQYVKHLLFPLVLESDPSPLSIPQFPLKS